MPRPARQRTRARRRPVATLEPLELRRHLSASNDPFAGATLLTGPATSLTDTTVGATRESGEPFHAANSGGHSIWFVWTAPSNGDVALDTRGSAFDTLLAVYTGTAVNALTEVQSNDDEPASSLVTSFLIFPATAGTTYHFAVDGYNGANGSVSLHLQSIANNDNFASASVLSNLPASAFGSNDSATVEPGEPHHANEIGGHSLWWSWTPSVSTDISIDTFGSSFDTLLGVYTGSAVDALTEVASSDDAPASSQSQVTFFATAGITYRIAVDGFSGATGIVNLNLAVPVAPPANDDFADAATYTSSPATGTNVGATKQIGEPDHTADGGGRSVWWSWTATATGSVSFDTAGSDFDTVLAVYTGTAVNDLTLLAANDNYTYPASLVNFDAVAGTIYYIAVDGHDGATGNITLNRADIAPPANDAFASPAALTGLPATASGSNYGATLETGDPIHSYFNQAQRTVWWSWTAPSSGSVSVHTNGSDFDTVLAIFTGPNLASLTPVASDDDSATGFSSLATFTAVAGTTYRIEVAGYDSAEWGDITLTVLPNFSFSATPGPDTIRIIRDPSSASSLVFVNNNTTPTYTLPFASYGQIQINALGGADHLIVDFANGTPLPLGGVVFDGNSGSDSVDLFGSSTDDLLNASNNRLDLNEIAVADIDVESRTFHATTTTQAYVFGGATHLLTGPLTSAGLVSAQVYNGAFLLLDAPAHFQTLSVYEGASVTVAPGGANTLLAGVLFVDQSAAASLDLADNTAVYDYDGVDPLPNIRDALQAGYAGGAWTGPGIRSSTAASSPGHSIGYAEASLLALTSIAGAPLDATSLVLRYTLTGDANLDNRVNPDDYALADRGRAKGFTEWTAGDFNYDAAVTSADLALLRPTPPAPAPEPVLTPEPILTASAAPAASPDSFATLTTITSTNAAPTHRTAPRHKRPSPKPKPQPQPLSAPLARLFSTRLIHFRIR